MYEIGVIAQFEAAHRLIGDFGPATRTHGHTYRLEVIVRGPRLREDNTLINIVIVQDAVRELTDAMHYRDLNDVPGLEAVNTTAEAVADFCWQRLAAMLRGQELDSLLVRVWESPNAYAGRDDGLGG